MARDATSTDIWRAGIEFGALVAEAQLVVFYRTLGMAGLRAAAPGENGRMIAEKAPAFAEAAFIATRAAMSGQRPDEVLGAWVRVIRRKTRQNARRLGRRQ